MGFPRRYYLHLLGMALAGEEVETRPVFERTGDRAMDRSEYRV
jgi:hypothetical protein